ncbi:unnamed protein product [Prunus armeniaca]
MAQKNTCLGVHATLTVTLIILTAIIAVADDDTPVMKDGSGEFKTIIDTVNSIPVDNTKRVIVYIGGGEGNHFFKECFIEGIVDFIFGSGKSLYLNTELHVLGNNEMTVITAQARDSTSEDTGYSFVHCNITGIGNGTYLGKAWRTSPRVVFAYTSMSEVITPTGWNNKNRPERDRFKYGWESKYTK